MAARACINAPGPRCIVSPFVFLTATAPPSLSPCQPENLLGDFSPTSNSFHGRGRQRRHRCRDVHAADTLLYSNPSYSSHHCRRCHATSPDWHQTTASPVHHAHSGMGPVDSHPILPNEVSSLKSLKHECRRVRSRPKRRQSPKTPQGGQFLLGEVEIGDLSAEMATKMASIRLHAQQ